MNPVQRYFLSILLILPLAAFAGKEPERDPMSAIKLNLSNMCGRTNDPLCAPPPVPPTRQQALANLIQAASIGDLRGIQSALQAGAPIDGSSPGGNTALTTAVSSKQISVVQALLNARANPNIAKTTARPLCLAAMSGEKAIVDLLLNAGANPNAYSMLDNNGANVQVSPVGCAVLGGNMPSLESIIQKGGAVDGDKNIKDVRAPLYWATTRDNINAISALCVAKANPNVVIDGLSLLRLTLQQKRYDIAEELLKCNASPNWRDANGVSELRYVVRSIRRNDPAGGIFLLGRFKPNYKDRLAGVSILEEALTNNEGDTNIEAMRALLSAGASPRDEQLLGKMLEHVVDQKGRDGEVSLMRDLLRKGASTKDRIKGDSILAFASRKGDFSPSTNFIEFYVDLIKADETPGSPDSQGKLPLLEVYYRTRNQEKGFLTILNTFMAKGIDINARQPSNGKTLLDYIALYSHYVLIKPVQAYGGCRAERDSDDRYHYCN